MAWRGEHEKGIANCWVYSVKLWVWKGPPGSSLALKAKFVTDVFLGLPLPKGGFIIFGFIIRVSN